MSDQQQGTPVAWEVDLMSFKSAMLKEAASEIRSLNAENEGLREAAAVALPLLESAVRVGMRSCQDAAARALVSPDQHSARCVIEQAVSRLQHALSTTDKQEEG